MTTITPDAALTGREALAREWQVASPSAPEAIARFYETSTALRADLDDWHRTPERRLWTDAIVALARQRQPRAILDVGAGGGHDLRAVRDALAGVPGRRVYSAVEPNDDLGFDLQRQNIERFTRLSQVPTLYPPDLTLCIDVLEHVPDPDALLREMAERIPVGGLLAEATATHDVSTPLHLPALRGWHPGHTLDALGFRVTERVGRMRIWERRALVGTPVAWAALCAWRAVEMPTLMSLLSAFSGPGWLFQQQSNDALITRSRSQIVTRWLRESNSDVLLMFDSDIIFTRRDAEHLVDLCRHGHDIVCGAYPVRSATHLAIRALDDGVFSFGPDLPPMEIRFAATGFVAYHRRVFEAMAETMPFCHVDQEWGFWPFFDCMVWTNPRTGLPEYLSEDWAVSERARDLGFKVWLDPTIRLGHLGLKTYSLDDMASDDDEPETADPEEER